ncbi:MAG: tetratricopeptide repeat protein [Myxococcales bacterium]|nr:tetratricopeptide repeat protein [Myxococcales bacterium]
MKSSWLQHTALMIAVLLMAFAPPAFAKGKRRAKGKASGEVTLFSRPGSKKGKKGKKGKGAAKQKKKKVAAVPKRVTAARATRGKASVEDIDDEVDILRELLEIERGSPSEADTLLELSYVLWDRAAAYEMEAYDTYYTVGIAKAKKAGNKAKAHRLKIEQQNLLEQSRGTKNKVIDYLKRVERRFRRFSKLDEVLYALGFHLNEMNRHGEAVDAYMRLVRKTPKSAYIPDAYLGIGNYYFGKNQGGEAMKWFEKVKKFPQSGAYGWALYYEAWVHYNRQNYRGATKAFVRVLEYSVKEAKGRVSFLADGTKYMVRSWSEYGDPRQAGAFFKQSVPGQEERLLDQLARYYLSTSRYKDSNIVLNSLIKLKWEDKQVVEYLFMAVENTYKQNDLPGTISAIERLSEGLHKHGTSHKRSGDIAMLLAEMASNYHAESERTLDNQVLAYAEKIYLSYLTFYPDHKVSYDMRHNHALALFQLGRWVESAKEYEKVIEAKGPTGKYAEPSAHRALICYLKTEKLNEETAAKDDDEMYKAKAIRPDKEKIVHACERYVDIAQRQKKKEDVPEALFVLARIYYQHNQFDKSGARFANFVTNYPDHKLSLDAARLMLSSFSLGQDGNNLIKWTDILIAKPHFNQGRLGEILTAIKENEDYNRCLSLKDQPMKAAKCLLKYAREYPKGNMAIRAMTGAAAFYRRARNRNKVIEIYKAIAKRYSSDARAPDALYEIGEIHRETAHFIKAAEAYEYMADTYPKADLSKAALQRAALIRDGLGQDKKVIANAFRALKMKKKRLKKGEDPDPADAIEAAEVAYRLTVVYLRKKQWRQAVISANGFVKSRTDLPQYLRLAALSNMANAWMNIRRGATKAKKYLEEVEAIANQLAEEGEFKKLHPLGKAAIAQAFFLRGELLYRSMLRIKIKTKKLKDAVKLATEKAKRAAMADKYYLTVEKSKNPRWIAAAASRRGRAQHEIGNSLENLPPPRAFRKREELVEEWRTKMTEKAEPYKTKAMELYRAALKRAAEQFAFDTYWQQSIDSLKELDNKFAEKATMPEFTVGMSKAKWMGPEKPNAAIRSLRLALFGRTRKTDIIAIEKAGGDQQAGKFDVAAAFKKLAFAHHARGQNRLAVMVGNAGLYVKPALKKDSELLTMMALSLIRIGDIQKGMQMFKMAADNDPTATTPLLNMVSIQIKRLDLESAIALLRKVLKRDPGHYWAQVTLPVALRRMDDEKGKEGANATEALAILDKLAENNPKGLEGHYNRCVIGQALRNKGKKQVTEAKVACEAALKVATGAGPGGAAKAKELAKRVQGLKDALEFME